MTSNDREEKGHGLNHLDHNVSRVSCNPNFLRISFNHQKATSTTKKQHLPGICAFQAAVFLLDDGFQGVIGLLTRRETVPMVQLQDICSKDSEWSHNFRKMLLKFKQRIYQTKKHETTQKKQKNLNLFTVGEMHVCWNSIFYIKHDQIWHMIKSYCWWTGRNPAPPGMYKTW